MSETYVSVAYWTAVAGRAFTHKHVESIQTGATISTGIRITLINLQFTPAGQKTHKVTFEEEVNKPCRI